MNYELQLLQTTRNNIFELLNALDPGQLNRIPEGFSNNLIWNAGHVLATQQLLVYGLSGRDFLVPDEFINMFRKGTRPEDDQEKETIEWIKEKLGATGQQLIVDYDRGAFKEFKPYLTSYGIKLKNVDQAIRFNNIHEGVHLGYMMALRKVVV